MSIHLYWIVGTGIIGLLFAFWKTGWITRQDEGTEDMKRIGASIADGAMAFLRAEYKGGFIDMPDIRTSSDSKDRASQHFFFTELVTAFGFVFPLF